MKFDPKYFVQIAHHAGIDIVLNSHGRVLVTSYGKPASDLWLVAAKKHKKKLLSHLKEERSKLKQVDLFDNI